MCFIQRTEHPCHGCEPAYASRLHSCLVPILFLSLVIGGGVLGQQSLKLHQRECKDWKLNADDGWTVVWYSPANPGENGTLPLHVASVEPDPLQPHQACWVGPSYATFINPHRALAYFFLAWSVLLLIYLVGLAKILPTYWTHWRCCADDCGMWDCCECCRYPSYEDAQWRQYPPPMQPRPEEQKEQQRQVAPPGWIRVQRGFYYNTATRTSHWTPCVASNPVPECATAEV